MSIQPRPARPRLVDVAELAGVDKAVVSRLVNNDPALNIRPETRARVEAAIKELGYRPNAAARSLRTARSRMIGLFIPDFANPVYAEIIKGAEAAATHRGYAIVAGSPVLGSRVGDYLDLLGPGRVDGVLFAGGLLEGEDQAVIDRLQIPWLHVNRRSGSANRYVVLDDERGAQLAVEHLIGLGHREVAHIAGPPSADTARRRRQGYEKVLAEHGLVVDDRLVHRGDYTPDGGYEATDRLLRATTPTAIFVANVASAIGVLQCLWQHGLGVPDDVSVAAIHDLSLAAHLIPPLTTVRMPLYELGSRAVELLLKAPTDQPIDETVAEPIELVVRASTGPPATGNRSAADRHGSTKDLT